MSIPLTWLGDLDCHNPSLVGGKASNLSRLYSNYPVPNGFCITTSAFSRWPVHTFENGLPPDLVQLIEEAHHRLAQRSNEKELRMAVRSSAVDEDGQAASYAGQYETYLNVIGKDALRDAFDKCVRAGTSDRVRSYMDKHNRTGASEILPAVLVQELIVADISAVAFSRNPISGDADQIVINTSWGFGESIVNGTVIPDMYILDKSDFRVEKKTISHKTRMTVLVEHGTREVDIPAMMSGQPAMTEEQITETARIVLSLEEKMGWPVDMECCWAKGEFHLLQCRPVTALAN